MNTNLLFDSEEQRVATERVLAAFKVKSINKDIDSLIAEVLKYAKEIDRLLEENNVPKRYLDKVSTLSENNILTLDHDLEMLDFRVKEIIEDLIKRINTRVSLITNNNNNLRELENNYDLDNIDLEKEIITAKLTEENFA